MELCAMYDNILTALHASSKLFCKHENKVHKIKPGWIDFVAEKHAADIEAFNLWADQCKI